jgi:hypothetical protein
MGGGRAEVPVWSCEGDADGALGGPQGQGAAATERLHDGFAGECGCERLQWAHASVVGERYCSHGASVENAEGLVFIAKTSTPRLLVVSAAVGARARCGRSSVGPKGLVSAPVALRTAIAGAPKQPISGQEAATADG